MSIRVGIMGYGNLGRGIECAIKQNDDMELVAVFTRRAPETVSILTEGVKVYSVEDVLKHKDENMADILNELTNQVEIVDLSIEEMSTDDVIAKLYKELKI